MNLRNFLGHFTGEIGNTFLDALEKELCFKWLALVNVLTQENQLKAKKKNKKEKMLPLKEKKKEKEKDLANMINKLP